jgi:hypothetical protein
MVRNDGDCGVVCVEKRQYCRVPSFWCLINAVRQEWVDLTMGEKRNKAAKELVKEQ